MNERVGTRAEWLRARKELLEREKELTRLSDELARQRQALPWVVVEKEGCEGCTFATDSFNGSVAHWGLLDRAPKGRDGGAIVDGWPRRRDEYANAGPGR